MNIVIVMKRNFALKKYNRKFLITCALLTEITFGAGLYWVYKRLQKSSGNCSSYFLLRETTES